MQKLYWKGISNKERIWSVSEITSRVDRYGVILNFQKFSDLEVSLLVEIENNKIAQLYHDLSEIIQLDTRKENEKIETRSILLFLNVSFPNATGDLEIEVPDIPK